jgi:hypothetical protein
MELLAGKRYIFVNTNNSTYTGDVVEVTAIYIKINHKFNGVYQHEGNHHVSRHFIKKAFLIDDLIVGQRYNFVTSNKTFEGDFVSSIAGKYESIQLNQCDQQYPTAVVSFPVYWIKDIRIVYNIQITE